VLFRSKIIIASRFRFYSFFFSHLQTALAYHIGQYLQLRILFMPSILYTSDLILRYIKTKLKMRYTLREVLKPLAKRMKKTSVGFYAKCSGRFTRKERAAKHTYRSGKLPLGSSSVPITYSFGTVALKYGAVGLKIYLCVK